MATHTSLGTTPTLTSNHRMPGSSASNITATSGTAISSCLCSWDCWSSPGVCALRRAHTRPFGTLTGCEVCAHAMMRIPRAGLAGAVHEEF